MMSSSSPVEKVVSMDDLLSEILLRLPIRSLLRFTSVSKHWFSIISNPRFKRIHSIRNPSPPLGLFVRVATNKPHLECEFVPFDIQNPVKTPFKTLVYDPNGEKNIILHSCNGLMLCCSKMNDYDIYNPTINQFVTLPNLENYDKTIQYGVTLVFDPLKSPYYRIVYVLRCYETDDSISTRIDIYSSQTRTFKTLFTFGPDEDTRMYFVPGVYWNNAIHWLHNDGFVAGFNLDQQTFRYIHIPSRPACLNRIVGWYHYGVNLALYIFESRDRLFVIEIHNPCTFKFKIYEMKGDYSGWSVSYDVDLEQAGGLFPEIVKPQSSVTFMFTVLSLVLGEKEDDSFLILQLPRSDGNYGKVVRFNLVSKTFLKLHDFVEYPTVSFTVFRTYHVVVKRISVFQFKELLYMV